MSKHTPGPWYVSTSPDYFPRGATVIRAQEPDAGRVVAILTRGPDRDTNARLIAAAPEMLSLLGEAAAVLRWYVTAFGNGGGGEYTIQNIDALLAKIEGTRGHA